MSEHDGEPAGALAALSDSLWTLRELLALTEFGLVVQRLIAEAGETSHLGTAAEQLDIVCMRIRQVEVVRAGLVAAAADILGCPYDVTLSGLAGAAPEPWATILTEHTAALRTLAASVAAHRASAERVLRVGADAVDAALRALTDEATGVSGPADDLVSTGSRLDRRA